MEVFLPSLTCSYCQQLVDLHCIGFSCVLGSRKNHLLKSYLSCKSFRYIELFFLYTVYYDLFGHACVSVSLH